MTRRLRTAIVAVAPTVLLVGFVYHPYVPNGTDESALAEAAASNTTRWGLAHLAIGIGSLGAVGFALSTARSGVLSRQLTWLTVGAFVVMAAARFVPLGAAQIVIGVAAVLALWPLALEMWTNPEERSTEQPRSIPAS
jgi:FtsH-binding integral membrane protein